jgi:hypothetical protein
MKLFSTLLAMIVILALIVFPIVFIMVERDSGREPIKNLYKISIKYLKILKNKICTVWRVVIQKK